MSFLRKRFDTKHHFFSWQTVSTTVVLLETHFRLLEKLFQTKLLKLAMKIFF